MATTIKWIDNNQIETAHRIYKSSTYFTKDNLPAPLVELGPDITEYVDSAGVDGENWYIVSALLNDYEVFSEPFIIVPITAHIHDVFGDGSAVATYNFDGDVTDLGGTYNGVWSGTESYATGTVNQAASFDGSSTVSNGSLTPSSTMSASFWVNLNRLDARMGFLSIGDINIGREYTSNVRDWDIVIVEGTGISTAYGYVFGGTIGEWNHLYFDSNLNVYVNGSLLENSIGTARWDNPSSNLLIGEFSGYTSKLDGSIDQLRIFNRALTQAEVGILYQEGAAYL